MENNKTMQMWSRGHKARGQGQDYKKNPRPRTDFPRREPLEAKDHGHNAQVFSEKTSLRAKKLHNFRKILDEEKMVMISVHF